MKFFVMLHLIGMVAMWNAAAYGAIVEPALEEKLARFGPQEKVPVIVKFKGRARIDSIRDSDRGKRRAKIIRELRSVADLDRKSVV